MRNRLATDIGAGTSYSMLQTLGEAYKVAMLRGRMPTAHELFHLASRGNASHLGLDQEIGTLDPGRWADVVVLNPEATPVLRARHALSKNLEDVLFALGILGDDRAARATYVAGRRSWQNGSRSRRVAGARSFEAAGRQRNWRISRHVP